MCDVIQSGGIIGGPYKKSSIDGKPVEVVFANPDLIWRSEFDRPRLGQGAFKESFLAVYKARCRRVFGSWLANLDDLDCLFWQSLTGSVCPHVQYGKPTKETYDFAKGLLSDRFKELYELQQLPSSM